MAVTTLFFDLDGTVSNNFDGIALPQLRASRSSAFRSWPIARSKPLSARRSRVLAACLSGHRYRGSPALLPSSLRALGWAENSLYDGIGMPFASSTCKGSPLPSAPASRACLLKKFLIILTSPATSMASTGLNLTVGSIRRPTCWRTWSITTKVAPANAVMIGDRDKGMEAALHAGTHSLGVLGFWQP